MKIPTKNKVAVIGASGYGGLQAITLLKDHPAFELSFLGGSKTVGKSWNSLFPFLKLGNFKIAITLKAFVRFG